MDLAINEILSEEFVLSEEEIWRSSKSNVRQRPSADLIDKFHSAIEIDPWNSWRYIGWGNALSRLGHPEGSSCNIVALARSTTKTPWRDGDLPGTN